MFWYDLAVSQKQWQISLFWRFVVHWIFLLFYFCVLTLWYLKLLCHSEPAEKSGRGENRMGGLITCNSSCYFQPGIVKRSCAIYRLPDAILTQNLSWMLEAVPNFCIILHNLIIIISSLHLHKYHNIEYVEWHQVFFLGFRAWSWWRPSRLWGIHKEGWLFFFKFLSLNSET